MCEDLIFYFKPLSRDIVTSFTPGPPSPTAKQNFGKGYSNTTPQADTNGFSLPLFLLFVGSRGGSNLRSHIKSIEKVLNSPTKNLEKKNVCRDAQTYNIETYNSLYYGCRCGYSRGSLGDVEGCG